MRTPLLLLLVLLHPGASWLVSCVPLPRAVIHIGPHKTSTTYIQASRVLPSTLYVWVCCVPRDTVTLEAADGQHAAATAACTCMHAWRSGVSLPSPRARL